jgi:hypothetical protein
MGRPRRVSRLSAVYHASPLPSMPPVPCPSMVMARPLRMKPAAWFWKAMGKALRRQ